MRLTPALLILIAQVAAALAWSDGWQNTHTHATLTRRVMSIADMSFIPLLDTFRRSPDAKSGQMIGISRRGPTTRTARQRRAHALRGIANPTMSADEESGISWAAALRAWLEDSGVVISEGVRFGTSQIAGLGLLCGDQDIPEGAPLITFPEGCGAVLSRSIALESAMGEALEDCFDTLCVEVRVPRLSADHPLGPSRLWADHPLRPEQAWGVIDDEEEQDVDDGEEDGPPPPSGDALLALYLLRARAAAAVGGGGGGGAEARFAPYIRYLLDVTDRPVRPVPPPPRSVG
jgi:hypothetical protein